MSTFFFPFSLYGLYFLQRQWETTVAENEIANHRIRAGFFFSHRFISTIVARLRDTMDWNVLPTSIHFLMNMYLIGEKKLALWGQNLSTKKSSVKKYKSKKLSGRIFQPITG